MFSERGNSGEKLAGETGFSKTNNRATSNQISIKTAATTGTIRLAGLADQLEEYQDLTRLDGTVVDIDMTTAERTVTLPGISLVKVRATPTGLDAPYTLCTASDTDR